MAQEKIVYSDPKGRFDFLEHTSDVYVRARGVDLLSLFENAGIALFEAMVDTNSIRPVVEKQVKAEGFDLENLLYKWLENLLTLYYAERIVCGSVSAERFEIRKASGEAYYRIEGRCLGEVFDPGRHEGRVEVKAVTYSLMRILKSDEWEAYVVLDI
ncbi:archease [Thermogladius sp. 4427co]|uniref:archease n=1 Tax=Thermogladius sp. 4427co TaxID=3450718 RepID=UPI003F7A70E9